MGRKRLTKTLAVVTGLFLMSAPSVWADVCVSDFDYDGNVYPSDLSVFLDEYGRIDCPPDGPAPVEWTGVTLCYDEDGYSRNCAGTGEDGEYQKGVDWPLPRFTDNGDGTATDKVTGLIWLTDANCIATTQSSYDFDQDGFAGDGAVTWQHALNFVAGINDGTYSLCGAGKTDWRLPNIKELSSLIDFSQVDPALPWLFSEFIAENENNDLYWSGTSFAYSPQHTAFYVSMDTGIVMCISKTFIGYVWPVRGGHD